MEVSHRHLLNLALEHDRAEWTDGQLLEGFVSRKDVAALEVLVSRHGPMVWGVCCRLLKRHDAEDAFQATFLILIRKAASIKPRDMVGNWLHGVARQAALNARTQLARRGTREVQVADLPEPAASEEQLWTELKPLLDQELSRLPGKYREAVLLCDLEGKSRKEAAQQLGLAEGTVASRLARGRSLLASRLARRGLVVSAGTLEAVLAQKASGAVPNALMASTIESLSLVNSGHAATMGLIPPQVASLTDGVLNAMFATKLKIGLAAIVMLGMGAFTYGMLGAGKMDARTDEPTAKLDKAKDMEGNGGTLLKVTIKSDTDHIRPRDAITLKLRVENVSKETVTFQSMTSSWDASWESSNKRIQWIPSLLSSDVEVTETLKAGETYEQSLGIFLAPGEPVDKISFKMGFTPQKLSPKSDKKTYWSNEITLQIDPPNKEAKPEKAPKDADDAAQLLKITIKPDRQVEGFLKVPPQGKFNLRLQVENVSKETMSFESATCSWMSDWKTSTKRVSIDPVDCFSNRLVTEKLKPGETYEKSLAMFVVPGDPVDKISFKLGFTPRKLTPKSNKETFWSNELTIKIDPANGEPGIIGIPAPMAENTPRTPQRLDPALLKARLDAAKEAYDAAAKSFGEVKRVDNTLFPVGKPDDVYTWSVRWLDAQLEMTDKKAERIAAIEDHIKRMKELQKKVEMAAILLPPKEVSAARWNVAEAEILLAKEKAK